MIVGHEARPARIDILVSPTVAMKTPGVVMLRIRMTPVGRYSARKTRQKRTPWRPTTSIPSPAPWPTARWHVLKLVVAAGGWLAVTGRAR